MLGRACAVQSYGRRVESVKGEQQEHSTAYPHQHLVDCFACMTVGHVRTGLYDVCGNVG